MDLKRGFIELPSATAKKPRIDAAPSPVLFFWNLPAGTTEAELAQLCSNFGTPISTLKLKEKNQAFVEMSSVESAAALLEYYKNQGCKPVVRGEAVDVQYSSRPHVTKKPEGPESAGNQMLQNMMLLPGGFATPQTVAASLMGVQQPVADANAASNLTNMPNLPGRILHINISKPTHPVSCDILYYVFSQYGGTILRICCFEKNNVQQALVEFSDANSALVAKTVLQDHSIFTDGCILRIDHSKLTTINIRPGDVNSRDYTAGMGMSMMPSQVLASQASPLLSSGIPGSIAAATGSLNFLNPSSLAHAHAHTHAHSPAHMHAHAHAHTPSASEGAHGKVILVSNLNTEKVSPEVLFKLFGTCGDVQRVKIMFNKRDSALLQFRNEAQAQQALQLMQGITLFGSKLHLQTSRLPMVALPPAGSAEMYEGLTQDYENSPLHRFNRPGSRNEQNIAPPSEYLHIANIPENIDENVLIQLFSSFGMVAAFKFFANTRKMAIIRYANVESAIQALIALHGNPAAGDGLFSASTEGKGLMISFAKSPQQQ